MTLALCSPEKRDFRMGMNGNGDRFFRTTRGQIVMLLRRRGRHVNELAAELGVTDNAVRAQLLALERDGLVATSGSLPGTRKPHTLYSLTEQAEQHFPKPYEPLLRELLSVLASKLSTRRMDAVLRSVGRRLAEAFKPRATSAIIRQRVQVALEVLGELGGLGEIVEEDGKLLIRGCNCPLKAAVSAYPGSCRVAETMLEEIIGAPVRERCERGPSPRCCFEILPNG
jgi:predicted ArsR family transcriptional regulator